MVQISKYFQGLTHIAPLAMFRVLFGFMMMVSTLRFIVNGWVYDQYIAPEYFFSFYGFEWVKPLGSNGMYALFFIMVIAALLVMLGAFYRLSMITFFLSFTYVELIDKTNYLNHYYFVSLISFILIWLPAHRYFSLDVLRKPSLLLDRVPAWTIDIIKFQLGIVYFYAGVSKLNPEWLLEALPLRIWLPPNVGVPLVGFLFKYLWVAYFFSWFGAVYDLTIPFFLLNKKTRPMAYVAVVVFHILTWVLFPIGMFPFIMIASTLIFYPAGFHLKMIRAIQIILEGVGFLKMVVEVPRKRLFTSFQMKFLSVLFGIYCSIQVFLPWRFAIYPGKLFWTEQGYRFSWRVMLMEKAGYVIFHVTDPKTGRSGEAYARDYLTPNQEKMMSTQPDMILQFAHYLKEVYHKKGVAGLEVRAEAYVTLNGRGSQLLIDPKVDLTKIKESFKHKDWILPFERDIRSKYNGK